MTAAPKAERRHISVLPCSVVDIEAQKQRRREGEHGSTSSRADYSNFPEEVSKLCFELYLHECRKVFDPFAGWGERAAMAEWYFMDYFGVDINPEAIRKAEEVYGVRNHLGDSRSFKPDFAFDGLVTCPPYWNLERYSSEGLDAIKSWEGFLEEYQRTWENVWSFAEPGAVFCVMVCDWRSKGRYYDFTYRTQKIFSDLGADPVDQVVVSRKGISKIKVMIPQSVANGYTVKVHENLLVFRKPS